MRPRAHTKLELSHQLHHIIKDGEGLAGRGITLVLKGFEKIPVPRDQPVQWRRFLFSSFLTLKQDPMRNEANDLFLAWS